MHKHIKKLEILAEISLGLILMGSLIVLGYCIGVNGIIKVTPKEDIEYINSIIEQINGRYEDEYIEDVVFDKESMIKAYVNSLGDKYATYMTPKELKEKLEDNNEKLCGIGVKVVYEEENNWLYVVRTYRGSPAEEVGIKSGDCIIAVNGRKLNKENSEELIESISGKENTDIELSVKKESGETEDITLTRKDIEMESVIYKEINESIVYIQIESFTNYSDEEFRDIIDKCENKNIIIDLRNNLGGIADTVIDIADSLLGETMIVKVTDNDGTAEEYYSDSDKFDGSIAVLINGMSASASELLAKTLQDNDRAIIIGENSYGKGTVLETYELSNGGAITLSTGKYYTISGDEIEGNGVKPDIEIALDDSNGSRPYYKIDTKSDNQIQRAIEYLETGG